MSETPHPMLQIQVQRTDWSCQVRSKPMSLIPHATFSHSQGVGMPEVPEGGLYLFCTTPFVLTEYSTQLATRSLKELQRLDTAAHLCYFAGMDFF